MGCCGVVGLWGWELVEVGKSLWLECGLVLCGSLPADDRALIEAESLAGKLPHGVLRCCGVGSWLRLGKVSGLNVVLFSVGVCLQTMGH